MLEEKNHFLDSRIFWQVWMAISNPIALHCIAQDKDTFWTQLFMQLLWKWLANWITLITWTWYLNEDELEHEHWTCRNEWRWTWTWNILGTNVEMTDKLNQNYHLNVKPGLGLYWKYQVCPSEHEIQWTWTSVNMKYSWNKCGNEWTWNQTGACTLTLHYGLSSYGIGKYKDWWPRLPFSWIKIISDKNIWMFAP